MLLNLLAVETFVNAIGKTSLSIVCILKCHSDVMDPLPTSQIVCYSLTLCACLHVSDLLGMELVKELLSSTSAFLSARSREVVKATLDFMKVQTSRSHSVLLSGITVSSIVSLGVDWSSFSIRSFAACGGPGTFICAWLFLSSYCVSLSFVLITVSVFKVKSVLSWGENSKNHFRLKSRVILERLVRKFRLVVRERGREREGVRKRKEKRERRRGKERNEREREREGEGEKGRRERRRGREGERERVVSLSLMKSLRQTTLGICVYIVCALKRNMISS